MTPHAEDPRLAAWRREAFETGPAAAALVDLSGAIVDCNAAFAALCEADRRALVGTAFAESVARDDREDVSGQLSKVVMGTMRAVQLDGVRLAAPGGRDRTVTLHAVRLGEHGAGAGIAVFLAAAASDRAALDVELLQAQKMQALGQLAGAIAHDFNNLLTAIIGFGDLLLERHAAGDPSHADIVELRRSALRGSQLVRQLLAFSRRQPQQPVVLPVNAAVRALKVLLDRLLGETVELRLALAAAPGAVRIDAGHFDQMIVNLAVNARDAMPGGGELTVRTAAVTVARPIPMYPEAVPPGEYVRIEVADTGIGIAREILGNVFEPFFTTKDPGAGTGLGLSTVYGIVRQAGGVIGVASAPGEGTTFTIHLPAATDAAAAGPEAPASAGAAPAARVRPPAHGATVLLVEDEDAVRQFAARALAAKGHAVLQAENGEAALDVVSERTAAVDLIVSDVVMPGMDGYTLSRLIRTELPHLKVILMSGYADEALAPGLARDPDIHFLPKPFTLAELTAMVDAVLAA